MNPRYTGPLATAAVVGVLASLAQGQMATRRWGTPPAGPPAPRAARPRSQPPTCHVVRAPSAPRLDGRLDDDVWKLSPVYRLARTLDGGSAAPQTTEVRLLRDEATLYLAFRCHEPLVGKVQASRRGDDGPVWDDDSIEVFLSPGGAYYHLGANAVGSTYDAKAKDRAWSSGLRAAAGREEAAWTVELAVPLAAMTGGSKAPEQWTANFNRNRRSTGNWQETAWSPTFSGDSHVPARFGRMIFGDPPKAGPAEQPQAPVAKKAAVEVLPVRGLPGVVRFDLSALPAGAKVYRADLLVFRTAPVDGRMDEAMVDIDIRPLLSAFEAGGEPAGAAEPLKLRGPWFDRFDATDAVRRWLAGKPNGGFLVKACPLWNAEATCLDVAYEARPVDVPPQVTGLRAFHHAGQTFLTWREIDDPVGRDEIAWGEMKRLLDSLDRDRRVRYCVYRSERPITAGNLHEAELIASVRPLSCWNVEARNVDRPVDHFIATSDVLMTGHWNPFGQASIDGQFGRDCPIDRFVIREGSPALPRGTGLYVHTAAAAGKACYAVVTSIDGVQNTASISPANSLAEPLAESPSDPEPVLQRELPKMPLFHYAERRLHYVRWVGPPLANVPQQAHNWSVGVPDDLGKAAPLELSLHRDGHSYWRTQYRIERDSIVLSPYDFPIQSWWYGYHESTGTLRSMRQGTIHPYTERRLLSFLDWACRKWSVDRNRILVTGCRGGAGASGALRLALRYTHVFNLAIVGHPVIDYESASRRTDRSGLSDALSMQAVWGKADWLLPDADGASFWARQNMVKFVRSLPALDEPPYVAMSSNHGDADSRAFYEAMLTRHFGILAEFSWGGARYVPVSASGTYPNVIRLDIRRDSPLLAISSAGGLGLVREGKMGDFNRHFRWRDVVDEPGRFEATIFLQGSGDTIADVAPRRCRRFRPAKGAACTWRLVGPDGKAELQSGEATVDDDGLVVLKGVQFPKDTARLIVAPK